MSLESQHISPARLAWIMGVSGSTVEEWVRRGRLPSFKAGRVRRFAPEDVLAFVHGHTGPRGRRREEYRMPNAEPMDEQTWARIERLIREAVRAEMRKTEVVRPASAAERAAA